LSLTLESGTKDSYGNRFYLHPSRHTFIAKLISIRLARRDIARGVQDGPLRYIGFVAEASLIVKASI